MGDVLTIGEVAARSGVATSALRFYEEKGLIKSERAGFHHGIERSAIGDIKAHSTDTGNVNRSVLQI